jgi:hypothetical protein
MAIDKIGSGRPVLPVNDNAKTKEARAGKKEKQDKVELSQEAISLFATEKAKKLNEIRAKVKSGFYEAPEVTQKVVEGVMRDIKRTRQA